MSDIKKFLLDVAYGLKKMFIAIGLILFLMSTLWGIMSALITIFGAMEFQWWNIPFWVLVVCLFAGAIGQDRD